MKVKQSPLLWNQFALLQFHFDFINPEEDTSVDPRQYFKEYDVEADFAIQYVKDDTVQVFFKTSINHGKASLPGYKLFVESTGLFTIAGADTMKANILKNLKGYSTVNLLINRTRHMIRMLTSESAFGPYEYPPIDITDLFKKKQEELARQKEGTPTKP